MPGFDEVDVQMDSPIRNKRRSTTRDSDEPTPKMRLESAPIATVEELEAEEKENVHVSPRKSYSNSIDFDSETSAQISQRKSYSNSIDFDSEDPYASQQKSYNNSIDFDSEDPYISQPKSYATSIDFDSETNTQVSQRKSYANSIDFDSGTNTQVSQQKVLTQTGPDSEESFLEDVEMEQPPVEEIPTFTNKKKLRRSISLPQLADVPPKPTTPVTPVSNFDRSRCSSVFDLYSSPVPITRKYRDAVEKRPHQFGLRRIFTKVFCMICKENLRFGGEISRCKLCKFTCHPKCQEKLTKACIPFKEVPKASNGRLKLLDYCSDTRPRLPHPVLRCVSALDGMLESMDLYITDVDPETVKTFCSDLIYSKHFSIVSGFSAKLISQALLKFLSELREPVVLKTSSDEFLSACENPENTELESVIVDLPKPHRNTLAYICLHFKRVFENSHINGLNPFKLAPKIISVLMRVNFDTAITEKYVNAFVRLVNLDNSFYERVIEEDAQEPNTPVSRSGSRNYVYDKLSRSITMSQMPNMPFQRLNFF
ncbi:hypothetical protein FO519_006799 [Halicephalobus sp. NKZ332]|nr:hypothetical protein FO519_006799 [Halicephalobus sp. NKZ332]